MNHLLTFFLLFTAQESLAQETNDSTFIFSGYVFDNDSVPIEGAYLLNCRTLRVCTTNESGYFRTRVMQGDSLVINHISYQRLFVYPSQTKTCKNYFYLMFTPYMLPAVTINDYSYDLANFNKNMEQLYKQLKLIKKPVDYKSGNHPQVANPYAPGAKDPGFGINLQDLFSPKRKKKHP